VIKGAETALLYGRPLAAATDAEVRMALSGAEKALQRTPGAAKLMVGAGVGETASLSVVIDHRNRKQRRAATAKERGR